MKTRSRRWAVVCAVLWASFGFAACALDESGTSDGGGGPDGNPDVVIDQTVDVRPDVAPDAPNDVVNDLNAPDADASLDADAETDAMDASDAMDAADVVTTCDIDASCVAAIPADAGWTLLGISDDGGGCTLQSGSLLADAQAAPGACTCGCTTSGTPTCGAATFAGYTDPSCGTLVADGSVAPSACADLGDLVADAGVAVTPPDVTGVECDASVTGNQAVVAQSFATCTATKCTDDYCALAQKGFRLCIAHDPPASCPTGFPLRIDAVASANVVCNGCSCGVKAPACTGMITTYGQSDCDGGAITSFAASSCTSLTDETLSIQYVPDTPTTPTCSASSLGDTVQTLGAAVVCCSP
jgi:hypothetical protein